MKDLFQECVMMAPSTCFKYNTDSYIDILITSTTFD